VNCACRIVEHGPAPARAGRAALARDHPIGRATARRPGGRHLARRHLWYFGGAEQAAHQRNVRHNPGSPRIFGTRSAPSSPRAPARWREPTADEARRIAETTRVKCVKYGVLAWDQLNVDATRFVFRQAG
jgi:hypothetical protein